MLTTQEWLGRARLHREKLVSLVGRYHPVNRGTTGQRVDDFMRITAPGAEAACRAVRQNIRENFEGDPVAQFEAALAEGNIGVLNKLLNDAWFGVPESTACWRIDGFREAVDLMDDLPEDDDGA